MNRPYGGDTIPSSVLTFERVTFHYQSDSPTSPVLGEVSFSLGSGELAGLFGRNGSGKSTLAMLGAGLLLPASGTVTVSGLPTSSRDPEIQRRVGVLFQNPDQQIVGVTVEEDLAFGLENLGIPAEEMRSRVRRIALRLGLEDRLRQPVSELSGGMRQRLALGGVMVMEPEFLILDEPTSQLDPWARQEFWEVLLDLRREHGLGILVVSPQSVDQSRLERALVLHDSHLAFDGPCKTLWERPELPTWGLRVPEGARLAKLLADSPTTPARNEGP